MNILKQIFWLCIQWADVAKAKNMKIYDFSHLDLSHFKLFLPAGRCGLILFFFTIISISRGYVLLSFLFRSVCPGRDSKSAS